LQLEEEGVKQEEGRGENLEMDKVEMIKTDQVEGFEMNETFDETKAAEEAAKETARIAKEAAAIAEAEATQLAAVRSKLSGESVKTETAPASESVESSNLENADLAAESNKESIENEPLGPLMQKYSSDIEARISQCKQLNGQAAELRKNGQDKEAFELERESAHKSWEILNGGGERISESFVEMPQSQKAGESFTEFQKRQFAPKDAYHKEFNNSPQMLLRFAEETGRSLDFRDFSSRLLRDEEFITAYAKTEAAKKDVNFTVAMRDNLFGVYANQARY